MKECSVCGLCFEDRVTTCPDDGDKLRTTLKSTVIWENKYLINRRLGQGGMGTVYEATQIVLQRSVAIKILSSTFIVKATARERFHREALAIAKLKHPNIVSVYDFGFSEDGYAYLVMEYINGFPLKRMLDRWGRCGIAFGIDIGRQICEAISMAHQHAVLHRDLKPENIMFEGLMKDCLMKVVDFGLAKLLAEQSTQDRLTSPNMIVGTYNYMSPEQCRGDQVDERSDIYALGLLFYEMFTGHPPFTGEDPLEIMEKHLSKQPNPLTDFVPDLPPLLESLILCALDKDPDQRPQTAKEMGDEMSNLLIELTIQNSASPTRTNSALPRKPAPLAGKAQLMKAQAHLRADNYPQELDRCRAALKQRPNDSGLQQHIAQLYQESGHLEEALEAYIKAGNLCYENGKLELALVNFLKVQDLVDAQNRLEIATKLAFIYSKLNNADQAFQQCQPLMRNFIRNRQFDEAAKFLAQIAELGEKDADYQGRLEKMIAEAQLPEPNAPATWQGNGQAAKIDLTDQTVLIVDPDPIICYQFARVLRELGCKVELASTGAQVLDIVKRHWPTLIIFETVLPDMNGSELFQRLIDAKLMRESIFICWSTNREDVEIDAAFNQGLDDYWIKPINVTKFASRVKRTLLRTKRRTQLVGKLSNWPFIEVMQHLEKTYRSGTLSLKNGKESARVYFNEGIIVNARLGKLSPIGSLYRILGWRDGKFHFRSGPAGEEQPLHIGLRDFIFAALNLFDEERSVINQFPPTHTYLKLTLPDMIILEGREQEVIKLFDGSLSIGEIFDHMRGDLASMRLALALYQTSRDSLLKTSEPTVITSGGKEQPAPADSSTFTRRLN